MVTGRLVLFVAAASAVLALLSGVSAAAPGFVSASSAASQASSATLTVSRPSSVTTGNVLVAAVAFRVSSTAPITPPAGWSQAVRTSCSHQTTLLSQAMFVKVATGAEPGDYTFTTNTSTGGVGSILVFNGVDPAQPVAASAGAFTRNTKGASPSITTTVAQTRLVGAYSHTGTALITAPTGMTSRSDAHTGGSAPTAALLSADELLAAAGTFMRRPVTASNQVCNVGQLVALRSAPAAPANTSAPTVSGTAREGSLLTASQGTWNGSPTGYAYAWQRCDAGGGSCADIANANGTSYLLASGDVGSTIRVVVTATNAGGSASASSAPTGAVAAASPPTNQTPPTISGSAREDETLSASTGTWSGAPSAFAYQWERCDSGGSGCSALSGADDATYEVDSDDVASSLRVVVTATNAGGSTSAPSAATAPVTSAAPTNTSPPSVSGVAREGETLTAQSGTWSGSPTSLALQWERCNQAGGSCSALSGEIGSTHVLSGADVGSTLRVVVTASNSGGSASASSAVTSTILPLPPANLAPPTVSGVAQEGETLSASAGTWSGSPTFGYQWERCDSGGATCNAVSGADESSYDPGSDDVGSTLRVVVTATNAGGTASESSAATSVVVSALSPESLSPPTISGTPQEGSTLTASQGTWNGSPTGYAYAWQRCDAGGGSCADIANANGTSYLLASGDVGSTIRVVVTATNAGGSASASSAPTGAVAAASPPTNQTPPTISGSAREDETLSASTGTWSGAPSAFAYQWERCDSGGSGCSALSGADDATYEVDSDDVASSLRVVVTATNAGGSTSAPSAATAPVTSAAPTNTSPPSVSGVAREGETLTAQSGTWSGSPTSLALQWERCNQAGGSCSALSGEIGSTHVLSGADVGSTLRVVVTASNSGGSASASSAVTSTILPLAPANLAPPTVSGVAQEGETLSASAGTWQSSAAVTYGYRWQRSVDGGGSWTTIAAATNIAYTLGATDVGAVVRVAVDASNAGGSTSATSGATGAVAASLRPVNTALPGMTGYAQVGRTLDATPGTWSGAPTTYAYQWQQSGDGQAWSDIAAATSSRYLLAASIVNRWIRVRVTASNANGQTSIPSPSVLVYSAGNVTVLVNKTWQCNAAINLDLVKVTIWTIEADAIVFNTGCTGRIGRIEVDTFTGDAMKVTNSSVNAAHDLVIESGYTSCFNHLPNAHQDGFQAMGGARITIRNFVWMCGSMADATGAGVANAVLIGKAGAGATTPTDIVVEHSVLMPGAAHTLSVGTSLRSGARNSVLCPDRTGSSPLTNTGATEHVYTGITEALIADPRCASFASALAWASAP